MDLKEIMAALQGVSDGLTSLKNTVSTKDEMKAEMAALEERVAQRTPAAGRSAIHDLKNVDRARMVEQLRFIMTHNPINDEVAGRAMGIDPGEAGGFLVPAEFVAEVQRKLTDSAVMRGLCRVWSPVKHKGSMPKETGTVDLRWEGENENNGETTPPKFGLINWSTSKLKGLVGIPDELFRNSGIDVLDLLSTMFAEQIPLFEQEAFTNGNGSQKPTGFRVGLTGVGNRPQAAAALAVEDILATKHKVKAAYRQNAVWQMHNDTIQKVALLKDAGMRYVFLDLSVLGGQGATNKDLPPQTVGWLLGNPVVENNSIPVNLGQGANETEIWYGDWKRGYSIFDEGAMEMSSTTEGAGAFEKDQVVTKVRQFVDGKKNIPEALAYCSGVK
jgi:HK97 family phage major capsid protein